YTVQKTRLLLGLGPSSLSDAWYAFAQNEKNVACWLESIEKGELAPTGGHLLSNEDLLRRRRILDLMCNYKTKLEPDECRGLLSRPMVVDGLVRWDEQSHELHVSDLGRAFVRNICAEFDAYLAAGSAPIKAVFSRAV